MSTSTITREYNGQAFTFREDGYFNMTKAAKVFTKRLDKFWSNAETAEYCEELGALLNSNSHEKGVIKLTETTRGRYGGTWGHPKLAVFFARWLDAKFAVNEVLAGRKSPEDENDPPPV